MRTAKPKARKVIKKVVSKLKKASKAHAGQAKSLSALKAGGKGGAPGQWSARKAQMVASAYKKAGGGYRG